MHDDIHKVCILLSDEHTYFLPSAKAEIYDLTVGIVKVKLKP